MLSTLVRIGGRLALAPIFITGGINAAKNPAGRPDKACLLYTSPSPRD